MILLCGIVVGGVCDVVAGEGGSDGYRRAGCGWLDSSSLRGGLWIFTARQGKEGGIPLHYPIPIYVYPSASPLYSIKIDVFFTNMPTSTISCLQPHPCKICLVHVCEYHMLV